MMVTLFGFGLAGGGAAEAVSVFVFGFVFGGAFFAVEGASFDKKSTALDTPNVIAMPNNMSATSALFSPSSAFFVVGLSSKSLD